MATAKNQSGFGYFIVILVGALILGIVVFVGFRVISTDEDQASSSTNESSVSQKDIQSSDDLDQVESSVEKSSVDNDLDTTEVDQDVNDLL